jgi:uncharacterized membrane protein YedE/YeeE
MSRLFKAFLPPVVVWALVTAIFVIASIMSISEGRNDADRVVGGSVFISACAIPLSCLFFLPTIVAGLRNAPSYAGILLVNVIGSFLFGLGWFVALVWACIDRYQQPVVIQQHFYQPPPPPAG